MREEFRQHEHRTCGTQWQVPRHRGHHMMGHGHGRGPGWGRPDLFGHGGSGDSGPWGGFFGGPGGGRNRLEKGLLRYIILDVLNDGPKHGYEIIKQLEERTQGRYSPSPGTLYPTLQYLEDLALVSSDQENGRRVYQIADAGRAELKEHAIPVQAFWSRFQDNVPAGASLHEINFLRDALNGLNGTIRGGLRSAILSGDQEAIHHLRLAVERFQSEVREIIVRGSGSQTAPAPGDDAGNGDNPGAADQS